MKSKIYFNTILVVAAVVSSQLRDANGRIALYPVPLVNRGHPFAGCPVMRSWSSACPGRYMITGASSWDSDEATPLFHLDVSADGVFNCCNYADVDASTRACVVGKAADQGRTLASCQLSIDYCDGGLRVLAATANMMCNGDYTLTAFGTYTHNSNPGYTLMASTGADDALIMTCYNSGVAVEVVPIGVCANNELPSPLTDVLIDGALNTIGPVGATQNIFILGTQNLDIAEDLVTFLVDVVATTPTIVYVKAPMALDTMFIQAYDYPYTVYPRTVRALGSNYFVITRSQSLSGCGSAPSLKSLFLGLMVRSGYYNRNSEQAQVGIVPVVGTNAVEVTTPFKNSTPNCLTQIINQSNYMVAGRPVAAVGSVATSISFKMVATQKTTIGATDAFSVAYLCIPNLGGLMHVFPGAYIIPSTYTFGSPGVDMIRDQGFANVPGMALVAGAPPAIRLFSSAWNIEAVDGDFDTFLPYISAYLMLAINGSCDHPSGSYTGVTGFSLTVFTLNTRYSGDPANTPLNTPYGGCPALNYFGTAITTGEFARVVDRVWSDAKTVDGASVAASSYIVQDKAGHLPYICLRRNFNTRTKQCDYPGATLPSGSLACKADGAYCGTLHIFSGSCFGSYVQDGSNSWTGSNVVLSAYTADGAPIFTCLTDSVVIEHSYCANGYLPSKLVEGYNILPYNGAAFNETQGFIASNAVIDEDVLHGTRIFIENVNVPYRVWIIATGEAYDTAGKNDGFYFTTGNVRARASSPVIDSIDSDSLTMSVTWNSCASTSGSEHYYMLRSPTTATGYRNTVLGVNFESWSLDLSILADITAPQTFNFKQPFSASPACLLNVANRLNPAAAYQSAIIDSVTPNDLTAWFSSADTNYVMNLFCVETANANTTTGAFLNIATSSYDASGGPLILALDTPAMPNLPMSAAIVSQASVVAGTNFITQPLVTSYKPSSVAFALPPVCPADVPTTFIQSAVVFVRQPPRPILPMPVGPATSSGLKWWGWMLIVLAVLVPIYFGWPIFRLIC